MGKSRRKNDYCGICAASDKEDKRLANRTFRRKGKENLRRDKELPIQLNEVSDVYGFNKDGKTWFGELKNSEDPKKREWYRKFKGK